MAPLTIATPAQRAELLAYQRRIRNRAKRAYALRYLEIGDDADGARDAVGTSFMGRQSVRLQVAAILRGEGGVVTAATRRKIADVVADVLVTAFEGGSNYWATEVIVTEWPAGAEYASDVVARGGTVIVVDDEDGRHELTRAAMVRGMRAEAARCGLSLHRWAAGCPDASGADNALQFALFGELIYG